MGAFTAPTQTDRGFHRIDRTFASTAVQKALAKGTLTRDDANLINEFVTELQASHGITLSRVNKIVSHLINWRLYICPYRTATTGDLFSAIATIKEAKNQRGRPFKQNTLHDYVMFLKRFYLWLIENGYSDVPEKKVRKIRPPRVDRCTKLPDQMLTPEEIEALLRACQSSRDRAIIALLYESGCRIGELGRLTWQRVQFDAYGIVVSVEDTKCHTQRYVRLVMATPYLATWRNDYPFEPAGDALVFITYRKKPLQHATVYQQFHKIAKRAGITKKITPHIFRHSRITHLINQGMKESVIKLMMWGNLNTDMFATYAHLTGQDIDREVLGKYGLIQQEEAEERYLEPVQCPDCKTINAPRANYCITCGRSFTDDREDVQEAMGKDVLENPELVRKLLNELIEEKKRKGEL
ncbi:site-specific integrase [Methanoculleus sp. 10]|uniref:site-specific integrase n=1 Tax=Methanoculleus sp. 10 TaxID=430615 RepID=UPI0025F9A444|nr:site-specific integrase [Methanoculleus sp. 10]